MNPSRLPEEMQLLVKKANKVNTMVNTFQTYQLLSQVSCELLSNNTYSVYHMYWHMCTRTGMYHITHMCSKVSLFHI